MSTPFEQMSSELLDEMGDVLGPMNHLGASSPERMLLAEVAFDAMRRAERWDEDREWFRVPGDPDVYGTWAHVCGELGLDGAAILRVLTCRWRQLGEGTVLRVVRRSARLRGYVRVPRLRRRASA